MLNFERSVNYYKLDDIACIEFGGAQRAWGYRILRFEEEVQIAAARDYGQTGPFDAEYSTIERSQEKRG